ncbi:unnamed protein product [Aphanomyces euteiches]
MVVKCFGGYGSFGEMEQFEENDDEIVAIGAGHTTTFAATSKALLGWGTAFHGELQSSSISRWSLSVCSIACGSSHVVVCTTLGTCLWWGEQFNRQSQQPEEIKFPTPRKVQATQVAAGENHTLVLDSSGVVYSWGSNAYGQCGNNNDGDVSVVDAPKAKYIAAGANHSAIISNDGSLYTFGWGLYHQLGGGSTENVAKPTCVTCLEGVGELLGTKKFSGLAEVACGAWHTAALTTTGDVYTWGWGQHGQLGHETLESQVFPKLLDIDWEVVNISCGTRHTTILTRDGEVHRWGFSCPNDQIVAGKSSESNKTHCQITSHAMRIASGSYHDVIVQTTPV